MQKNRGAIKDGQFKIDLNRIQTPQGLSLRKVK